MRPRFTRCILTLMSCLAWAGAVRGAATGATATLPIERDPLVQDRDLSVRPGVDFFRYANGGWMRRHPIPPSERGWGIANVVREQIYSQLREICESAAQSGARRGSSEQRVGDFWSVAMDSDRIEREGTRPLAHYLDDTAAVRTRAELLRVIARFQVLGFGPAYGLYVGQDERRSDHYAIHLVQGGVHLPDRDYYFASDPNTRRVRLAYPTHLRAMFRLLGDGGLAARGAAATVVRLETALARRSRTLEQLHDPWANYHKLSLAQLNRLTPAIDWREQFAAMDLRSVDTVIVAQPEFFTQLDSLVRTAPLADWKSYLRWCVVNDLASALSRPLDREHFHFFGTVLSGTPAQRPRWKRVIDAEENGLGELMGQVWVKRYCPPATKARYEKLTRDIIDVYRDRIAHVAWMSEATRRRALVKLSRVARKVAYPDHWRDYSTLRLDRGSYAGDRVRVDTWWFRHEAAKLGKPIDRTEWDMTPQTYNAYYEDSKVEIVLPAAAFLLPGVPDSLVDDALLYSYAGAATIGHEITHGFDDSGRQFDARGNLNPWWTVEDSVRFQQRAHRLVEQFDRYVVGGLHVRGLATLGENIADLGGVRLGYEAFKKTEQWKRHRSVNGLTPDQRFFLGYALGWMGQYRPQTVHELMMSDVHAPSFLRVNGPLSNLPEFYAAFGVTRGDPMWRPDSDRVEIW